MKNNEEKENQQNNPLHGVTLQQIVEFLVAEYGWIELNRRIEINCFYSHPSIKSSLKFLRKENWARIQVERLYLNTISGSASKNRDFHE
ncbi:MAG TPA: VF530 family protein [Treponemataceae bacterium]|nr:VF530 family protein [Treponemataceae bacterium]